jgi:hypothetical protein
LFALEDAAQKLVCFFPELEADYRHEVERWEGEQPGPYVIYEDLFYRYIERVVAGGEADILQRVFDFLELLATAEDARLQDLLRIAILTPFTVSPAILRTSGKYMGDATRRLLKQVRAS